MKIKIPLLAWTIYVLSVPFCIADSVIHHTGEVAVKGVPFEGNGFFRFALVSFNCTDAPTAQLQYCYSAWSNDNSSTQGTQPEHAIQLVVSNGRFSINLGDSTLNNMTPFISQKFIEQLYLRTWFDDGKNGIEQLKPDQRLTSAPNAMFANEARKAQFASYAENAIGINQSWQDVTGSRAYNLTYRNTTGKPITVSISIEFSGTSSQQSATLMVGRLAKPETIVADVYASTVSEHSIIAIVPNLHYYKLEGNPTPDIYQWSELR